MKPAMSFSQLVYAINNRGKKQTALGEGRIKPLKVVKEEPEVVVSFDEPEFVAPQLEEASKSLLLSRKLAGLDPIKKNTKKGGLMGFKKRISDAKEK